MNDQNKLANAMYLPLTATDQPPHSSTLSLQLNLPHPSIHTHLSRFFLACIFSFSMHPTTQFFLTPDHPFPSTTFLSRSFVCALIPRCLLCFVVSIRMGLPRP
ncbi:hypothetical protein C8R46DRAFT_363453 [Mycena filopes]|nr:hypothetical protein C8R46DRAFT_363453 [Mycena filopes]